MAKKQKCVTSWLRFSFFATVKHINLSDYQKPSGYFVSVGKICHSFACSALYRGQYPSGYPFLSFFFIPFQNLFI